MLIMGSDQYCLKWNNHWANLVRVFNSLRHSETFVDVTIACEGRHLKAHRLILSACSPYFKELLVSHPDKHPIIILKDVRYAELQNLIQFIYNGEVSVEQHDLPSLLCTARELQIKGLADNCISNSLPTLSAVGTTKASHSASLTPTPGALKDSTNTSSILLPTKPKEQPTYVNVNVNTTVTTTTTTTTSSTAATTTATPSVVESDGSTVPAEGGVDEPPPLAHSRGSSPRVTPCKVLGEIALADLSTPKNSISPPSPSVPLPSAPFPPAPIAMPTGDREKSPLSKRRKLSRPDPINDGVSSPPEDVIHVPRTSLEDGELKNNLAGPSGVLRAPVVVQLNEVRLETLLRWVKSQNFEGISPRE